MHRQLAVLLALCVACASLACRSSEAATRDGTAAPTYAALKFRLGHIASVGSLWDTDANEFVAEIERLTGGSVQGTVYPNGQLASQQEVVERMQLGELEIALSSSALMGVVPEFGIFDLPFAFQNRDEVKRAVDGQLGQELSALADRHNLVLLAYWENGFRQLTNNVRPIRAPADLRGLRIRTPPDPERVELFHVWGAKPSPLDLNQLFVALKAGVFDGQENPVANIVGQRLFEVQRYISMTGHIYSPNYVLASKQWWDSLEPRVQTLVRRVALSTAERSRQRGEQADLDAKAKLTELGMQVDDDIDKAAFQRAAAPVYARFKKRFGAHLLQLVEEATGRAVTTAVDEATRQDG